MPSAIPKVQTSARNAKISFILMVTNARVVGTGAKIVMMTPHAIDVEGELIMMDHLVPPALITARSAQMEQLAKSVREVITCNWMILVLKFAMFKAAKCVQQMILMFAKLLNQATA